MSFWKALRYFVVNPRYTLSYRWGNPATVLHKVTGQPVAQYETFRKELLNDSRFGPALTKSFQEIGESFLWNQDHFFLYSLIRLIKPRSIVETGVFDGVFSACILQGMHENAQQDGVDGLLASIDLPAYQPISDSTSQMVRTNLPPGCQPGWLIPAYLRARWQLHLGDSRELLPAVTLAVGTMDLFFHDSLHTYDHMLFEYQTAWPHLKMGAVLLSHDVHWNRAFRNFVTGHHLEEHVVHGFGAVKKD
jgi:Methyltransferase domain